MLMEYKCCVLFVKPILQASQDSLYLPLCPHDLMVLAFTEYCKNLIVVIKVWEVIES